MGRIFHLFFSVGFAGQLHLSDLLPEFLGVFGLDCLRLLKIMSAL